MNLTQLSSTGVNSMVRQASLKACQRHGCTNRLEHARLTILYGCIIAAIGIVLYCLVMSDGDPQAELATALAANNGAGWLAFIITAIGVCVWGRGYMGYMRESDLNGCDSRTPER